MSIMAQGRGSENLARLLFVSSLVGSVVKLVDLFSRGFRSVRKVLFEYTFGPYAWSHPAVRIGD